MSTAGLSLPGGTGAVGARPLRQQLGRDDLIMRGAVILLILWLAVTELLPVITLLAKSFQAADGSFVGLANFQACGDFNVLATDVHKQMVGQQNFQMGAVVGLVLLLPAVLAFAVARVVQRRQAALLTSRAVPLTPKPDPLVDRAFLGLCSLVAFAIPDGIGTALFASLATYWPYNLTPSLKNYDFDLMDGGGWESHRNSLTLATLPAVIGTALIFSGAYLVEKTPRFGHARAEFQFLGQELRLHHRHEAAPLRHRPEAEQPRQLEHGVHLIVMQDGDGSLAPMGAVDDAFRRFGVEVTVAEARGPMGMAKRPHVATLMGLPRVREAWRAVHGSTPNEANIDAVYDVCVPLNIEVVGRHAEPRHRRRRGPPAGPAPDRGLPRPRPATLSSGRPRPPLAEAGESGARPVRPRRSHPHRPC